MFFYRPFCKWLCPLGAFYGLCNRISICRLQVDSGRCTACGACSRACRMDVDVFRTPNHAECIRCGDCAAACPHGAITRVFSIKTIQERNINLIGVGTDSGESREQLDTAREILKEKGVTYHNISPDPEGDFYKDFVADISTYPTTYIVDGEGNIVGADIVGNVKKQLDTVETRLALITGQK